MQAAVFPEQPRQVRTSRVRKDGEYYSHKSSRRPRTPKDHRISPRSEYEATVFGSSVEDEAGTPTVDEDLQSVLWNITNCPCGRILALAQDNPADPLPRLDEAASLMLRKVKPNIRLPWQEQKRFSCLVKGGGEMGDRIRNHDWASHPLGKIDYWPQARVEMVGMILASPVPMTAYLESEAYVLYNDAYIQVLGSGKHPQVLGYTASKRNSASVHEPSP